jgi:LmbE family N-acetylglucosaminyl deacetylase
MRPARSVLALLLVAALLRLPAGAQVRPVYDEGAAGLAAALQRLTTTASVLHTGAHPDDEDSAFMARTARGDHARVAYLSLTRGEGGQNIIGPELFESLGIIRTEELLQARRLDGGLQFFTRAFDFGFSKTRAETAERWNERDVLSDMVRVIRSFRPLVVYTRFSGAAGDGHGHHQMAGHLTPLAFDAAADPSQFTELDAEGLHAWQARKLYRGAGRGGGPGQGPALALPTGVVDPFLGRSFAAIAAEGRSQHKSQGMGTLEPLGPSATSLLRVRSVVDAPAAESSVFDGIDVTVPGLAALAGLPRDAIRQELAAMSDSGSRAIRTYEPATPHAIVAPLGDGLRATRAARAAVSRMTPRTAAVAHADALLQHKEDEFADALMRAAGVTIDPLADADTVPQGGSVRVHVRTFVAGAATVRVMSARLRVPDGWTAEPIETPTSSERPFHAASYRVDVPAAADPTMPYYLRLPRPGDMYGWPASPAQGLPFGGPPLEAEVALEIGGASVTIVRPVEHRRVDRVRGELRRRVDVVPPVGVTLDSPLLIVPSGRSPATAERIVVRTQSFARDAVDVSVRLAVPKGWTASPEQLPGRLEPGATISAVFEVMPPATREPGTYTFSAQATALGRTFDTGVHAIEYPHIQTHRLYVPAEGVAQLLDLQVAPVRVGYIMGSGDQVPEALRRMDVDVTLLDDEAIASGDLSRFDTIVVGIRAAEARPAFVAHQGRLRQFMERGGALVVQYQQQYASRDLLPYPAEAAGNSRVTDERAPVTILEPSHPLFTFPNRIASDDFDGWVQERNLYAMTSFDARYTPLLEATDPGEPPQRGAALYARVGKGHYVYTAYSWFRQLPAGVPGAYRQFANLISLPQAP